MSVFFGSIQLCDSIKFEIHLLASEQKKEKTRREFTMKSK